MADIVRLLPDSIANQIAAGEVVQRPSSVVKELLENSLDAGVTNIKLVFRDGGQTLIQVIDNGKGMSPTDARMCWERHATSKIKQANDLFDLKTFGFRGEAMASIAAVAQVELKTKPDEEAVGTHIIIEASEVKKQEPVPMENGTIITVKNLFYNIPVRRNFLKSIAVETKYIIEEFQRVALSRPDVACSLYNGNNEVYNLAASDIKTRIETLLLKSKKGSLIPIEERTEIVSITGFAGSPDLAKKTRGNQYVFVNNRFIKEPYFNHAIVQAYEGLIETGHHPFYVLFLEVEPSKIDVNVHPTKTEVKFEDGRSIYQILSSVLKKALATYNITPTLGDALLTSKFDANIQTSERIHFNPPDVKTSTGYNPFSDKKPRKRSESQWEKLYEPFRDDMAHRQVSSEHAHSPKLIEHDTDVDIQWLHQLHGKYIVAVVNQKMCIIEQRRAHERILFEKYKGQLDHSKVPSQQLLFPRTLKCEAADYELITQLMEEINHLGFDISPFGKDTLIINGTPADIGKGEEQEIVEGLIDNFKANQQKLKLDKRENLARSLAKNACIKNGMVLEYEQMRQLVVDLFQCDHPNYCPNGKPVLVQWDATKLTDLFN